MSYSFPTMWMNGRFVSLDAIAGEREEARTKFEQSTFGFIRAWLGGTQDFSLQTSGSTGPPKTITVTREQMMASARLTEQALSLQPFSNALICIDTQYIGGKMMIVRSFVSNMAMWAMDPDASPLQKLPVDQCVNFAAFVPYQVQTMLGSKHPHLMNNPDTIIIGGAALDEQSVQSLNRYQCKCYAAYGMTETVSHVALRTLNGEGARDYFEALHGVELSVDERRCLVIRASWLGGEITTNDIVELLSNRQFRWLGRWDNVINTGGHKVLPEKVEAAIQNAFTRAQIRNRFFVHGVADEKLGSRVVLVIEESGDSIDAVTGSLSSLAGHLHPYEWPKEVLVSPAFLLTDTGKVSRSRTLSAVTASYSLPK